MLTIVPTPIGNLKDITLRALEVLQSCDGIVCEDTRRTSILLNHYQIKKPLMVLNDFNEAKMMEMILPKLASGDHLVLVSDAGTPLVSDPGFKLVRECLKQGIQVDSLPGAVAAIVALTLSGLPPDKFLCVGYLPEKEGARAKMLEQLKQIGQIIGITFIVYVAPFKLVKTLEQMRDVYGDIDVMLALELSKIHQQVLVKKASEWLEYLDRSKIKGEITLLFRLVG